MRKAVKPTYVLGIYTGHNATACLLRDGRIIACVSEERFNSIKNYLGFPKKSIGWCLELAKISSKELDLVVLSSSFSAPIHASLETKENISMSMLSTFYLMVGFVRTSWGRIVFHFPKTRPIGTFLYSIAVRTIGSYTMVRERKFIAKHLNIPVSKIVNFEHHLTHGATAYYSSVYNQSQSLVLTLDAEGDKLCSTVSIFEGNNIKRIASTSREHSLGWIYFYVTKYLGMKPMEHEYKVMGLAPYSKEKDTLKIYEKIKNIIILDPKNPLKFKAKFNTQDTYYYLKREMGGFRFDNIAGAFQKLLEDRMTQWVESAIKKTGIGTVIFSGGVFMNVKANQKIVNLPSVRKCFFMPSAGDESLPIGSCYLGYINLANKLGKSVKIYPLEDLYLGPSYSNEDIEKILRKGNYFNQYKIEKLKDPENKIAELLSEGKIVARLSGRMEFGARALGNRSILADPRNIDVVRLINDQMKNRDFWMPFAPSILEERAKDYLVNSKDIDSDYMMISFDTTKKGRIDLKAAMHPYDFTIRPQVVKENFNPKYYKLLKEFEKLTGIGGVLNTSFNIHGFPIVLGPKEALYAFQSSGLTHLSVENYLITKFLN